MNKTNVNYVEVAVQVRGCFDNPKDFHNFVEWLQPNQPLGPRMKRYALGDQARVGLILEYRQSLRNESRWT